MPATIPCPFCDAETLKLEAFVGDMETRAPEEEAHGQKVEPAVHVTAILMTVTIHRMLAENEQHPQRVIAELFRRVMAMTGKPGAILFELERTENEVAPTSGDVREMDEEDLAALKDLPQA